jgi:protease PrsW
VVLAALGIGLTPVLAFLTTLVKLDRFRLAPRALVLRAVAAGALAAGASWVVHAALLDRGAVDPVLLRRWVAPVLEETLKALWIVWLLRADRVGFLVDAGIHGFAVGAGFALIENLYYATAVADPDPLLWLVRGFGTAVMHGGVTAAFAIVAKDRADRRGRVTPAALLPGFAIAVAVHAAFNHLPFDPLVTSAAMLVAIPLLVLAVFERSERATEAWLGSGLDADVEALELLAQGAIADTRIGRYLETLRERFPGAVVADMLCLLQIHLELAARAKGMLIARAAGIEMPPDPGVEARFAELRYLERAIGATGRLALEPLLRTSSRDLWQVHTMRRR